MVARRFWLFCSVGMFLVLGAGLTLSSAARAAGKTSGPPVIYTKTPLPPNTLTGGIFGAARMNNVGDVVADVVNNLQLFWRLGSAVYLAATGQTYDGDTLLGVTNCPDGAVLTGINDSRQLVGTALPNPAELPSSELYSMLIPFRAMIAFDGAGNPMISDFMLLPLPDEYDLDFPPPPDGYIRGYTMAINNDGDVVGTVEKLQWNATYGTYEVTDGRAILWPAAGGYQLIGSSAGNANDINDSAPPQVTGTIGNHAFRYTAASDTTPSQLLDLGELKNRPNTTGISINSTQVAGNATGGSYYTHAVRYSNGVWQDLGTLYSSKWSESHTNGMNGSGHVVGQSTEYHDWTNPRSDGFLWTSSTGMIGLSTLVSGGLPAGSTPIAVNDYAGHTYGQILLQTSSGAYVLTPDR